MDETQRNKDVARRFVDAMGGDFARAVEDVMAEDCRIVTQGTTAISGVRGKADALKAVKLVGQLFPGGLPTTIHAIIAEGDTVAMQAESHATHVSGRPYNNKYAFWMRFRDGKLIEMIEYLDTELVTEFFGGSV
jgi:ketosteroid isomerase-like protein